MKFITSKISKRAIALLMLLFAASALATGGNGNEPPTIEEGDSIICEYVPFLCFITNSGTGGNGNEPPRD